MLPAVCGFPVRSGIQVGGKKADCGLIDRLSEERKIKNGEQAGAC